MLAYVLPNLNGITVKPFITKKRQESQLSVVFNNCIFNPILARSALYCDGLSDGFPWSPGPNTVKGVLRSIINKKTIKLTNSHSSRCVFKLQRHEKNIDLPLNSSKQLQNYLHCYNLGSILGLKPSRCW